MEKIFNENINKNILVVLLVLLSLLVFAKMMNEFSELRNPPYAADRTIEVSADGEVFATPDVARFNYTATEDAETLSQAQDQVAEKINQSIEFLEEEGIAEEVLQTRSYTSNPIYSDNNNQTRIRPPQEERTIVGYQVRQSMSFELKDLDSINSVISGLGQLQLSNIQGPNFTFSDEEALLDEARRKAIDKAKDKAQQLASDLGVRLGNLVDFHESRNLGYHSLSREMAVAEDSAAEISMPTGEDEITASVNLVFQIR